MTDFQVVASYSSSFDAQVAHAHLESLGIPADVQSDDAGGVIPSLTGLAGGARVLVRSEDAERAREALKEIDVDDVDESGD
jgi:hypothetical protein